MERMTHRDRPTEGETDGDIDRQTEALPMITYVFFGSLSLLLLLLVLLLSPSILDRWLWHRPAHLV